MPIEDVKEKAEVSESYAHVFLLSPVKVNVLGTPIIRLREYFTKKGSSVSMEVIPWIKK